MLVEFLIIKSDSAPHHVTRILMKCPAMCGSATDFHSGGAVDLG